MTEDEVRKAFEEATDGLDVDSHKIVDEVYIEAAEEMKSQLPPEEQEQLDKMYLITPSQIRENPLWMMRQMAELQKEHDDLLGAYHAARHVIGALVRQYGWKAGVGEKFKVFLSDDVLADTPRCIGIGMERDVLRLGFELSTVPHQHDDGEHDH